MLTLEQIRAALKDRRPDAVCRATGLHYNTVREVRNNPDANPTWSTIKALSEYLEGEQTPFAQYEQRKREWVAANPGATPREYEAAITRIAREVGI